MTDEGCDRELGTGLCSPCQAPHFRSVPLHQPSRWPDCLELWWSARISRTSHSRFSAWPLWKATVRSSLGTTVRPGLGLLKHRGTTYHSLKIMMEALFHHLACWWLSFLSKLKLVESCDSEISAVAALVARSKRHQHGHYWLTLDQIKLTNLAVRRSVCGELLYENYQDCFWLLSCLPPNPHTWSLVCQCCFQFTVESTFDALYLSGEGHHIYCSQRRASYGPYRELTQLNCRFSSVLEYLLQVF